MARTSTRYRIRYQGEQIERYFLKILDSLQMIEELALERSDVINQTIPIFVLGVNECQKLWDRIKAEL
jgi:hypothetical protein